MDWTSVATPSDKIRLAQEALRLIPRLGVTANALACASVTAGAEAEAWRLHFPGGLTEVLWFVSEVSDASMVRAFKDRPAASVPDVIATRLDQNVALKPFVRQVMRYDLVRPAQATARMQRTARAIFECTGRERLPSTLRVAALNLFYTLLVMVWLADPTQADRLTKRVTRLGRWL